VQSVDPGVAIFLYRSWPALLEAQFGRASRAAAGGNREIHSECPYVPLRRIPNGTVYLELMNALQRQARIGLNQTNLRRTLLNVLILQCFALSAYADVPDQELQRWVDKSTLIFTGKIVTLTSNVGSIPASENPMTVKVDSIELGNDKASQNFGSLVGKEMTVVVNPLFKFGAPERKPGVSAVFFVNPLLYEENIAVTAEAVADDQAVKDLPTRLNAAIEQKTQEPIRNGAKGAVLVVTGMVQEIRQLPKIKIDRLRSLANGRDLYSEHSPRWREAVIRIQSVLKGNSAEKKVIVVFPSAEDRMWAQSPKFAAGQSGIWLLHSGTLGSIQLADERARILLAPEAYDRGQIKAYTSLRPEDFRPKDSAGKNEASIREILKSLK